ncbi:MAG: TIGR04283 family arsenosugar biosynthesis glycosyltransferase [Bdellovibrionota bacterium]
MNIDVIIPLLNEENNIQKCLEHLVDQHEIKTIVVVDGGSHDASVRMAESYSKVKVVSSPRGRAKQLNEGIKHCENEVLWFVHADARVPKQGGKMIVDCLRKNPSCVGGAFRIQTIPEENVRSWVNPILALTNFRSLYTRYPYGDQAIFARKTAMDHIQGFPDQSMFEDYEVSKRLWTLGSLQIFSQRVRVSGRRVQQRPFFSFFLFHTFPLLYRMGVSPDQLSRWYKHIR